MARDADHPGELRRHKQESEGVPESTYSLERTGKLIIVEGEFDKLACNEVR